MTSRDQYHFLDQDIKDVSWGNIDSDWTPPQTLPDLCAIGKYQALSPAATATPIT